MITTKKDDSTPKHTEITEKHRKEFSVIRFPRCPSVLNSSQLRRIIVLLIAVSTYAANPKIGTTSAQFLKIGVGRPTGMGEAFVAVADDASAAYWNPGGLARLTTRQVILNHIDWIADVNHDFVTVALPLKVGTVAFSVTALTMGGMNYTITDNPITPAREDTWAGPSFGATQFALGVSYSRMITDKLSFGITAKAISEQIWDNSASGIGMDLGLFYNTGFRSLKLGAVISNFGSELSYTGRQLDFADTTQNTDPPASYKTTPSPLPTIFRFGIGYNLMEAERDYLLFAADLVHPSDINETVNFGLEYCTNHTLFLRAGYILNTDSEYAEDVGRSTGICAGLGLAFKIREQIDLKIDVGYRTMKYLGGSPRMTLNIGF
ncbi:MAG: PorV/PorQ family protein [candidate division WOR-3 bacterium]|nr:PorV/PorQ family protein [candidate division WOR-3 bacterium]MDH5683865.1 PorV/PorQ family protein [candidate division WOR-3 bacterium]